MSDATPLIHVIRELRAKVASKAMTLDEAATQLVAASTMTMVGARDVLSQPSAAIEAGFVEEQQRAAAMLAEARREQRGS